MEWGVDVSCIDCQYLYLNIDKFGSCEAFPEGIPHTITSGQYDHRKKYKDQKNDIVFEPITKTKK